MKYSKLLDSLTQLRVQGIVSQESSPSPTFCNIQPTNEFEAILSNFPDVTQPQHGNNPINTMSLTILQLLVHILDPSLQRS